MVSRIVPVLNDVQTVFGYRFNNVRFLQEALQLPGRTRRSDRTAAVGANRHETLTERSLDGNKRLAVLGDTVLRISLLEDWYHKGYSRGQYVRNLGEPSGHDLLTGTVGFINHMLTEVASDHNLNVVGRRYQLDTLINATRTSTFELSPRYVANTLEAVLGAAYLDDGMTSVRKVLSNVGLEYKALHPAKFTDDGHSQGQRKHSTNQQGPASRIIQSVQQLQCLVDDVLLPANWTQLPTDSVDPLGLLGNAIVSGSQCLDLLTDYHDILLESATLNLDSIIIDTVRSSRELRSLILAWRDHVKLRLWRQEIEPWRPGRNLQKALRGIKSSFTDLTGLLRDKPVVDKGLMSEQRVIDNNERSFERLTQFTNLAFSVPAFGPETLLTTLQRRIESVVRSGRQMQSTASSLREFRGKLSMPRPQVQHFLPRPPRQQVAQLDKSLTQQAASSMLTLKPKTGVAANTLLISPQQIGGQSFEPDKQVQDLTVFFRDPAKRKVIQKSETSFQQLDFLVKELHLYMNSTAQLISLRMGRSGREVQSIANSLRQPAGIPATQKYKIWFFQMPKFEKGLHLGTDATSETGLAYLRKPLQDAVVSGRQVQSLAESFYIFTLGGR